jgi:hypothetical protein
MGADYDPAACDCYRCTDERYPLADMERDVADKGGSVLAYFDTARMRALTRYFLCPLCGNKRCPHATDHWFACTNSNLPGQAGSRYQ